MLINSVSSINNVGSVGLKKVAPQPKMINGLANDTFQKSSAVSSPINTYKPSSIAFKGIVVDFSDATSDLSISSKVKLDHAKANFNKRFGGKVSDMTFTRNKYTNEKSYCLKATVGNDDSTFTEFYDNDMNKTGEEETTAYLSKDSKKLYKVKKTIDFRTNVTTKVREEFDSKTNSLAVTDEVKIYKDKNNKVIKKEMMTNAPVKGTYNQKVVYPDGTEKIISDVKVFKKYDDMECIHKDMTSLDGTRTQYKFEQDKKGNRLLEYKITDKDGNVLMNLNKTMEKVGDNKFISSNGDKVYETTFDEDKITIQERGKDKATVLPFKKSFFSKGLKIVGQKDEMMSLLKNIPAEQLLVLKDTVKVLNGIKDTNDCSMIPVAKQIDTINDTFSLLHESGHAVDYRKSNIIFNNVKTISNNDDLRKIYTEEKENFNKAFPDAQREHVEYFINQNSHYGGKWGGLQEVIAETNALRDSYTTEDSLAPRVQYLQQYYPKTIAFINNELENYKK